MNSRWQQLAQLTDADLILALLPSAEHKAISNFVGVRTGGARYGSYQSDRVKAALHAKNTMRRLLKFGLAIFIIERTKDGQKIRCRRWYRVDPVTQAIVGLTRRNKPAFLLKGIV